MVYPTIREADQEREVAFSASHVVSQVSDRLNHILQSDGPQAIAMSLGGGCTNETYYLATKFSKACLRNNNVSVWGEAGSKGLRDALGNESSAICYEDLDLADGFILAAPGLDSSHPVLFDRIVRQLRVRARRGIRFISPDASLAPLPNTLDVCIQPGTESMAIMGILAMLVETGGIDKAFIDRHVEQWESLQGRLREWGPTALASACGLSVAQLTAVAERLALADGLVSVFSNAHDPVCGGLSLSQALANLHLATGQIGSAGAGILPLPIAPNAQGARDTGCGTTMLPAGRSIQSDGDRMQMSRIWGLREDTLRPDAGLDLQAALEAALAGKLKALWLVGIDPLIEPQLSQLAQQALPRIPLLIVQNHTHSAVSDLAHVNLPATHLLEQAGTMTSPERCVSLAQAVATPPAESHPDWWWILQISQRMGFRQTMRFRNEAEIFDEFARITAGQVADLSALTYAMLEYRGPQQWPFAALGGPESRLWIDGRFGATEAHKARLQIPAATPLKLVAPTTPRPARPLPPATSPLGFDFPIPRPAVAGP